RVEHGRGARRLLNDHRAAARSLGLLVQEVQASTPDAIEPALASVAKRSGLDSPTQRHVFQQARAYHRTGGPARLAIVVLDPRPESGGIAHVIWSKPLGSVPPGRSIS